MQDRSPPAPTAAELSHRRSDFPPGFLFGTATSAYQIEGSAAGGAGPCHWDSFAATPGNVVGAEDGRIACDHLHRWEGDLDLVAGAGFDLYRFSTSWARVQPEGRGAANPEGLDFYDRLVDGLLARGLKPALTLYHWELPSPLADLGGWTNRDIADRFADFAGLVAGRLGDRLHSVAPINEPWCVAWLSHFLGRHAPGLRDIRAATRAMHHVPLAHGRAVAALRAAGQRNVGAVCNFEYALPADDSSAAAVAASRYDAIYNRWFLGAMTGHGYPAEALEGLGPHMPAGWEADLDTIAAPLDWIGLNYYTCARLAPAPGPWPAHAPAPARPPLTDMGWEICPEGLGHFLRRAHTAAPGVPLIVTENGMATAREPDHDRIAYIDAHLSEVRAVIAEGVPVTGYIVWSLMDNYEWAEGYARRFGIVQVDFDSLQRSPRASWQALAQALRA